MSVQQISATTRTARKPHACWVCGAGGIKPGDTYQANTNVYDGRIYTLKMCIPCDGLTPDVWDSGYWDDDGAGPDDYYQWAKENLNDPRATALLERIKGD